MSNVLRAPVVCALLLTGLQAEIVQHVRGELQGSPMVRLDNLVVELRPVTIIGPAVRVMPANDGSFDLRGIDAATYDVTVTTQHGQTVAKDIVHLGSMNTHFTVRLPKAEGAPAGPVSIRRLTHKTVPAAAKEFRKARKASDRKHADEAELHLERAVALDPEYFEALNDLAVQRYRRADYAGALRHLETAHRIDPGSAQVCSNLAAVMVALGRADEGLTLARKAVAIDGGSPKARLVLSLAERLKHARALR